MNKFLKIQTIILLLLASLTICVGQVKNGKDTIYYESGEVCAVVNFKNGKLYGKFTEYYKSGGVWAIFNYKNGKLHGKFTWYYKNGRVKIVEYYKDGIRVK